MDSSRVTINHWMISSIGVGNSAEELWAAACSYFMWCESHPIYEKVMIKQTGAIIDREIPRPFNLPAMCVHLGVSITWILDIVRRKEAGEYNMVAERIMSVIHAQKYEYGVVGIFNPVIIGKDLGLDKSDLPKQAAVINITIDQSGPPLITNEQDVKL